MLEMQATPIGQCIQTLSLLWKLSADGEQIGYETEVKNHRQCCHRPQPREAEGNIANFIGHVVMITGQLSGNQPFEFL